MRFMLMRVGFEMVLVRQFASRFQLGMRDHAFFFRRGFLFLEFGFFVFVFRGIDGLHVRLAGFRRCVRCRESAFLRIPRRQIVLRVRDMFRECRDFFLGQIRVFMAFVRGLNLAFAVRLGSLAGRFMAGNVVRLAENMRFVNLMLAVRLGPLAH